MGKDRALVRNVRRLAKEEQGKELSPVESFVVLENMVRTCSLCVVICPASAVIMCFALFGLTGM